MRQIRSLLLGLVLAGCASEPDLDRGSADVISDSAHGSRIAGVWFLPPMVPQPSTDGVFDEALEPSVTVHELSTDGKVVARVAEFSRGEGTGSEVVRVEHDANGTPYFILNFHTDRFALDPAKNYRIAVWLPAGRRGGHKRVAFADIDVGTTGKELKNIDTNQFIPLVDGRTLPIKFYINEQPADDDFDGVPNRLDNCPTKNNPQQQDADGDGVGNACEARIEKFAFKRLTTRLDDESDAGVIEIEVDGASVPGDATAVTIHWGDGSSSTHADGKRIAASHTYAAPGTYRISADACGKAALCKSVSLGDVRVLADKSGDTATPLLDDNDLPGTKQRAHASAIAALDGVRLARGITSALDTAPTEVIIDPPDPVTPGAVSPPEPVRVHTRMQQHKNGVPIFGAEAIVHQKNDGTVATITDDFVDEPSVSTTPLIGAGTAIAAARSSCTKCAAESDLWILPRETGARLAWRVQLYDDNSATPSMPVRFIDAETQELLLEYDNLQTNTGSSLYSGNVTIDTSFINGTHYLEDLTRKIGTFDNRNGTGTALGSSLFRVTDTDGTFDGSTQRAAVDAHYGAMKFYDYFKNVHGRNGIDNAGGPGAFTAADGVARLISSRVHYSSNYNNAFWNGSFMTYGDGDGSTFSPLVTLDICGHEMTHGVIERTARLVYSGESGALNESWADVFGAMVERSVLGESANTWKIGEQAYTPGNGTGDALRYLDNPHGAANSGFTSDDDPDHYSERYTGTGDNGGVHINSGIPNKAFHLLAVGGTHHRGGSMIGIGADDAAKIWYKALTTYMTSSTNFAGARTATINAAINLFGTGSTQVDAVMDAWALVGVGVPSGGDDPPPPPPSSGADLFSNGGFETTASPTVLSGAGAFYTASGNFPHAGTGYVYLGSQDSVVGQAYQQITIPSTATSAPLTFWLNVSSSETTTTTQYDKLFVEVRNTSGVLIATLATFSNLNKTETKGVYAHRGIYNLLAYRGQTVRIQFRVQSDSSLPTTFRIDDVSVGGTTTTKTSKTWCGGVLQPSCPDLEGRAQ